MKMGAVCSSETLTFTQMIQNSSVFALPSPVSEAVVVDVGPGMLWILMLDANRWIVSRNAVCVKRISYSEQCRIWCIKSRSLKSVDRFLWNYVYILCKCTNLVNFFLYSVTLPMFVAHAL
jgi:hypothetical protein